jgi:hypothetical protein
MLDSWKVGRVHCITIIITSRKWHTSRSLVLHTEQPFILLSLFT